MSQTAAFIEGLRADRGDELGDVDAGQVTAVTESRCAN